MALAKVARCRLHESALGQSPGLPWPERELLWGSYIETLLWGFLPAGAAGLQNDPTERKQSRVPKRMLHIVHIRMYMIDFKIFWNYYYVIIY
jgi:hypothetical protein